MKGSGGLVRLCLNFRNTNTQVPITVVFPPGLVFISDSDATLQDSSVLELTGLLQDKAVPLTDPNLTIQTALWDITDGSGMTASDREAINKL
jgi:hypothetical protein